MKRFYASILFLLLLVGNVFSTDFVVPEQKIVGVEEPIPVGEVVVLKPSRILDVPKHLVGTGYSWVILENGREKTRVAQGVDNSIFFGSGTQGKRLTAILYCNYLYVVREGDKPDGKIVEVATRNRKSVVEIIVGTPDPNPNPGPGPNPTPDPVIPDSKYGLTKLSFSAAKKMPTANRVTAAKALAKSYRGMSSKVAAGAINKIEDLLKETASNNRSVIKDLSLNPSDYRDFSKIIEDEVFSLYNDKKLNSMKDFADAWLEIADGLEKVVQ